MMQTKRRVGLTDDQQFSIGWEFSEMWADAILAAEYADKHNGNLRSSAGDWRDRANECAAIVRIMIHPDDLDGHLKRALQRAKERRGGEAA